MAHDVMTGIGEGAFEAAARRGAGEPRSAPGHPVAGRDTMSRIAGGIGHEFRNLLMIIQNYAEFIEEKLDPGSELREDLTEIIQAAQRGAELTNELLAFGRSASAGTRALGVEQALDAVQPRLLAHLGEGVRLRVSVAPGLPAISVEAERFGQILETVVRHAIEALETCDVICIEASATELDERYASEHPSVSPGRYVAITVSNTDCRLPAEVPDQEYDAQFATTSGSRGGLGLALAQGVMETWGGVIQVRSDKRLGTVVRALLPSAHDAGDGAGTSIDVSGMRVLLCEDERAIRTMCDRALRQGGFEVVVAEDGDAGIHALAGEIAAGRRLDLLVSDIVMPGSSGFDVADAARERYPDIAILLVTGYSEELSRRDPPAGTVVLEKPFATSTLLRRVLSLVT